MPFLLSGQKIERFPLKSLDSLEPSHVKAEPVHYIIAGGTRFTCPEFPVRKENPLPSSPARILKTGRFEVDIAGTPPAGTSESARGSVGIAFRLQGPARFECFYLRVTNARADDQARRNHTLQYISVPDFPFERTRAETQALYESYADPEVGVWTRLRIVVKGVQAKLYVKSTVPVNPAWW